MGKFVELYLKESSDDHNKEALSILKKHGAANEIHSNGVYGHVNSDKKESHHSDMKNAGFDHREIETHNVYNKGRTKVMVNKKADPSGDDKEHHHDAIITHR